MEIGMTSLCGTYHFFREVDAYASRRRNCGEQVAPTTAKFEDRLSRRDEELAYVGQPPMVVVSQRFFGFQSAGHIVPVTNTRVMVLLFGRVSRLWARALFQRRSFQFCFGHALPVVRSVERFYILSGGVMGRK